MDARKPLFFIIVTFFFYTAHAQVDVGGAVVSANDGNKLGFNVRGFYHLKQTSQQQGHFRFGPGFSYYQPGKDKFSEWQFWEINVDAQYLLGKKKTRGYAIMGLSFGYMDITYISTTPLFGETSGARIGINLGVGVQLFVKKVITPFAELKTVLGSNSKIEMSVGLMLHFGGNTDSK